MVSSFLLLGSWAGTGSQSWNLQVPRYSRRNSPYFRASAFVPNVVKKKAIDIATVSTTEFEVKESVERVRQYLQSGAYKQLAASSYDTAWVAMVPAPGAPEYPCFSQCLNWILENQHDNGSWGGHMNMDPCFLKDNLSSTLACILALKKWNCDEQSIRKGLHFIRSNFSSIFDENLATPLGFNIIFPGMLAFATDMDLDLLLGEGSIQEILSLRDLELKRGCHKNSEGRNQYLAYVAEGLGCLQDWNAILKYQKRNGSLFNSPSTTAAAYTQTYDNKAFNYLTSLVRKCGSAVPTMHPTEIYTQLCIVDTLERMGISHYFADDIQQILGTIHSLLLERDEEVVSDMTTCALAFRLLRTNGFDVFSELLTPFEEADSFYGSVQGYGADLRPVIEIYKASQTKIFPNEQVLHKLASWSRSMLQEHTSNKNNYYGHIISEEVEYALKFPLYHGVHPLENKKYIERFAISKIQMLKTSFPSLGVSNAIQELAIKDFNFCQSLYREELHHFKRWFEDCKLDQIRTVRQELLTSCYMSALATFYPSDLSDARVYLAKNTILTTYIDDLSDEEGSIEELECFLSLFDRSTATSERKLRSKKAEILFSAIHSTITEMAIRAIPLQGRDITNHLFEFWGNIFRSNLMEKHCLMTKTLPAVKEYIEIGAVTIGLGVAFVPSLYFLHTEVFEEEVRNEDFHQLLTLTSICIRLLNDIRTFEKERNEKALNVLLIYSQHDSISLQEAKLEVQKIIESTTRELLQQVLSKGNTTPKPLKEAFWNVCIISHFLYNSVDGFSSPKEYISMYNAVLHKPIGDGMVSACDDRCTMGL